MQCFLEFLFFYIKTKIKNNRFLYRRGGFHIRPLFPHPISRTVEDACPYKLHRSSIVGEGSPLPSSPYRNSREAKRLPYAHYAHLVGATIGRPPLPTAFSLRRRCCGTQRMRCLARGETCDKNRRESNAETNFRETLSFLLFISDILCWRKE